MFSSNTIIGSLLLIKAASAQFALCTADKCENCPASVTSDGTGYPECVIYDTNTVTGGQGFEEGTGQFVAKVFFNFPEPGPNCNTMVRSPASTNAIGCGNLIYQTNKGECTGAVNLKDTFMVQFCCGEGDCTAAGVPFKRDIRGRGLLGSRAQGIGSFTMQFENGTVIEPLEIGIAPESSKRIFSVRDLKLSGRQAVCSEYKDGSYTADGEPYLKTFNTQILSATVGPFDSDQVITNTYEQSVSKTTSFSVTVGDPFGIVSATVGFEFTDSKTSGVQYDVPVPAGSAGQIGFTPVFRCTKGSIQCTDGSATGESCTAYVLNGVVQGDYSLVQT